MLAWILTAVVFVACWFGAFLVWSLLDEDVNHWDWPSDRGPGALATARGAVISAAVALVPAACVWLFVR